MYMYIQIFSDFYFKIYGGFRNFREGVASKLRAVQLSNLIRSIYQHFKVNLVKQEVELDYYTAKRQNTQRTKIVGKFC